MNDMAPSPSTPPPPPTHLLSVLRSLWQWRRPILLTTLAGAILSIVVSLLLPTYYTGFTSFVAISPEQVSIESTFGNNGGRVQFYGTGDDIDRLLSVAESNALIDYMVEKFSLFGVYGIDSTSQKGTVRVRQEFLSHYAIERSPRDIIEISIEDRDPLRAATMATAARDRINTTNLALIRATHGRNAQGLHGEIIESEQRLTELNTRVSSLRKLSGIYDTNAQREALATSSSNLDQKLVITDARLAAFSERGMRDSIRKLSVDLEGMKMLRSSLDEQLGKLNENVGQIENLEEERVQTNDDLSLNRKRLQQYESILSGDRNTVEVIEAASVPLVKSSPIRWLIVVVSTIVTFLFAVVGALLIENGRRFDWRSITR